MSANTPDQLNRTDNAGVPPAPPEAHQKAGIGQWSAADLWILARAEAIVQRRDFSMLKAPESMESIAKYIASKGYRPSFDDRAVYVADPVYSHHAGQLVQTGYRDVTIRSMAEARRFIDVRS